jgi:hypothetical protein
VRVYHGELTKLPRHYVPRAGDWPLCITKYFSD